MSKTADDDDDARHARNAALLTASLSHSHAYAHSIDFGAFAAGFGELYKTPPSPLPSQNEQRMYVDPNGEFLRSELRDLKARIVKWADVHEAIRDFVKVDLIGYNARQTTQIPGTHDSVTYPNLVNRGLLLLEENVTNGRPRAVTPAIKVLAAVCDKPSNRPKRAAFAHVFGVTASSVVNGVTTTLPLDGNAVVGRMKLLDAWRTAFAGHAEAAAAALQFERENEDWVKRLPPIWNQHCEAIKLGAGPQGVGNKVIPRFVGDWADTRSRCVHPEGLPECSAVDLTPVPINPAPTVREMYDTVRAIEGDDLLRVLGLSMAAHISKAFNHIDDAKALIGGSMPHEAPYGLQSQSQ